MLVRSVEVRFQGWYWWLGRQNKSAGSEGGSLPQFPCCGGTECPVLLGRTQECGGEVWPGLNLEPHPLFLCSIGWPGGSASPA